MTAESIAALIVSTVQAYLFVGLLFAVPFVLFLANRVDPSAKGSTWGFRVLVIPGVALLWPLLLIRLLKGQPQPTECNAHRRLAVRRVEAQNTKDETT
jgi:hypothetical protein